jgi:hypothetical protein
MVLRYRPALRRSVVKHAYLPEPRVAARCGRIITHRAMNTSSAAEA